MQLDEKGVEAAMNAYGIDVVVDGLEAAIRAYLEAAPSPSPAPGVVEALRNEADRAYCRYLDKMSRKLCLGEEAKLRDGKFGAAELDAHREARELLGFHRGVHFALASLSQPPSNCAPAQDDGVHIHTAPANPAQVTDAEERGRQIYRNRLGKKLDEWKLEHVPAAAIGAGGQAVGEDAETLKARAASVLCEAGALCGWPAPNCNAREGAEALFKAGLLALSQPHPADERVVEALDEGLSILTNLIDNIKRHGNYSAESTCMFIDQAGASIRAGLAALAGKE